MAGWPCWVNSCGSLLSEKTFERRRTLERDVVVMGAKKVCMSMMRRAVLGGMVGVWNEKLI